MFTGLSAHEVRIRQQRDGQNHIPPPRYRFLRLLGRQCKSVFIIILLVAAAVTFLLGEPFDAGFIIVFVVLGISLSLFQEYKSNAAVDKLRTYLMKTTTVRRDGVDVEVSVEDVVVGDLLLLESGDVVPADAVVRHTTGLQVDETTFTGESVVVAKEATDGSATPASLLLQGTVIVYGLAYAEVVAIGTETRLAKIVKKTSTIENTSELTKGVNRISTFIIRTTVVTLIGVILANILIEGSSADIPHLLIFSITLAVSVIPEALPLVMTFSLSHAALTLAKKNVIVKRLSSVQDLGAIELLCTDKTGTITENKLIYQNDFLIPESPYHPLVWSALTSHNRQKRNPEPFDLATYEALSSEQQSIRDHFTLIEEEPFEPILRSNGARVQHRDGYEIHIRRGSPEYFISQGLVDFATVHEWLNAEEQRGNRVLGVSYDYGDGPRFGGFISFMDKLKPSTKRTLDTAKALNVAVTIITGDSLKVAQAVGRDAGLVIDDTEVIEATAFLALPAPEQYERVGLIRVFARTTPEQKLSLITLLKQRYVVGFLGEGINDAAALKAADVSLVVQSASDVARETADIVLTKSNLGVIIDGIKLGRETHANTLKYIRTTLVSNFGNFYAVAIGSLFVTFLPMLPKQLLLLNLLSDFPMMAIAFDRVKATEITKPQKYDFRALYIIFITLGLVSTVFDFLWFGLFFREGANVLQTNWFIASVITEVMLIFSIRSMLPIERVGWPAPTIIGFALGAGVITIVLPLIPITAHYFEFTPPSWSDLTLILGLALVYLVVSELVKRSVARFLKLY